PSPHSDQRVTGAPSAQIVNRTLVSPRLRPRRNTMKWLAQLVAAAVLTTPVAASAQSLTEAQARAVITPWYSLFNQPVQGDMKTLQEQVLTADYESCWGYLPGE